MLKKADHRRKERFVANQRILNINFNKLQDNGVSLQELGKYFPKYISEPTPLYYGRVKYLWFFVIRWLLAAFVKMFLHPRKKTGNLDPSEINEVYTKEAKNYGYKHHFTTRGIDLVWRRMAGWFVSAIGRNKQGVVKILDICTGTGLTIKEILAILKEWEIEADITGLDYNVNMLAKAENIIREDNVQFVHGDATKIAEIFGSNSIDTITQVFGIGGIPQYLKVFDGVLQILKPGGRFLMIDTHKPVPELPGELPIFLRWFTFPTFEIFIYEEATIPLVLNRLWGWRDATLCFYFLPLITYKDGDGRYWGFKVETFEQESQRWWFSLPLMPIAKIVVEKNEISQETAKVRGAILESCSVLN